MGQDRMPPLGQRRLGRSVAWRVLGPFAAALLALVSIMPGAAAASSTWTKNLWMTGTFLYQDPYYTACTAATTMFMLNTIALRGTGGPGFTWRSSTAKNDPANPHDLTSILAWERQNDTLAASSNGSDAHGWRNALNYFGWGRDAMIDPARMVYQDHAFTSFAAAVHAAVSALARYDKPVGILAWAGGHAQVLTGYVATGDDPRRSNDFSVAYVWLSDPLKSDGYVDRKISVTSLQSGDLHYRFRSYLETDSPYDDPFTPGYLPASVPATTSASEWYRRWVIVAPVRTQLPPPLGGAKTSPTRRPASTIPPSPVP
ncbi:MAG TPA: hypothetical protein VFI28_03945 [Candidatus Limnocylindrales bacterium]|nr:hypothetical protein [Candidatus Limnocylindrales bacterium]